GETLMSGKQSMRERYGSMFARFPANRVRIAERKIEGTNTVIDHEIVTGRGPERPDPWDLGWVRYELGDGLIRKVALPESRPADARAALLLRAVQRAVGACHQLLEAAALLGARYADRERGGKVLIEHRERPSDHPRQQALRGRHPALQARLRHQGDELVAAQPRRQVAGAQRGADQRADV